MCKRYHIEVEPGCIGTFSTPNPSPETLRILKDVIRMAMEKEATRVSDSSGPKGSHSDATEPANSATAIPIAGTPNT